MDSLISAPLHRARRKQRLSPGSFRTSTTHIPGFGLVGSILTAPWKGNTRADLFRAHQQIALIHVTPVSLFSLMVGQIDTIGLTPWLNSWSHIAFGSGQYWGSNFQSPCSVQWKNQLSAQTEVRPSFILSAIASTFPEIHSAACSAKSPTPNWETEEDIPLSPRISALLRQEYRQL